VISASLGNHPNGETPMTERQFLILAAMAHPAENLPRLMLADSL
jgi:hypothetical protein